MDIIFIAYIVLVLSLLNLTRMGIFLIVSDAYEIKRLSDLHRLKATTKRNYYKPLVSVLVPAHNEELVLRRNLDSIYNSDYKNIELIIINDSSTDKTQTIARSFQKQYGKRFTRVKVLRVHVRGKAPALNAGIKVASGSLFMCLDADSALSPSAITNAVNHFKKDKRLIGLSSNVKILPARGMLNLMQRIEYLVGYQMKKAEIVTNTLYIIGGVGSMFRTNVVRKIGGYDTNTITEDIDLSMKLISKYGSKKYRISYAPDVTTLTEAVLDVPGLIRQRYRWKYGRYQTFLKNRSLFWSRHKDQNKLLGWLYLPYGLVSEALYFAEPIVFSFILFLIISSGSVGMLAGSVLIFLLYTTVSVSGATTGYSRQERNRLIAAAPVAYLGMYVLSFVEYVATLRGFMSLPKIIYHHRKGVGDAAWKHVQRSGDAVAIP